MDSIPVNDVLKYLPGQLQKVRNIHGFQNSNEINECLDIIEFWIQKQNHFVKKDFDRIYLEILLISCKGSTERSKKMLDRLFTFRTILPDFFEKTNVRKEFQPVLENILITITPKPTNEYYRLLVGKFLNNNFTSNDISDLFKFGVHIAEYMKQFDYVNGFILIFDIRQLNITDLVAKLNPLELQKAYSLFTEGFGMRIKGIHILSPSKLINTLVTLLKQVFTAKVAGRIHVHQDIEMLYNHVPKDILPEDFGGFEEPMRVLVDRIIEVFSTEERIAYMKNLNMCGTDESLRQMGNFNEEYLGMPGTFRRLNVD